MAVRAVYGQGEISPRKGHAYGNYTVNTAPYLLAWMVGSEWDPYMVQATNEKNHARNNFRGKYFLAGSQAGAFEAWLAAALEDLAVAEADAGWQHPVSFVNWVTTDPLQHSDEPFPREDLVSVDSNHIVPTNLWQAGYFASYHVYPYYPDSLVYQQDYRQYTNKDGVSEPYEGYVRQLLPSGHAPGGCGIRSPFLPGYGPPGYAGTSGIPWIWRFLERDDPCG